MATQVFHSSHTAQIIDEGVSKCVGQVGRLFSIQCLAGLGDGLIQGLALWEDPNEGDKGRLGERIIHGCG